MKRHQIYDFEEMIVFILSTPQHVLKQIRVYFPPIWVSLVAQTVKRLPAMRETRVQSVSQKDPLEQEMATLSSILSWKIPWTEEPGRLQSMGSQRVGYD